MRSRTAAAAGALVVAAALTACGQPAGGDPGAGSERVSGPLTVFAAASLTDAFEQLGEDFTRDHPDVELTFSFAASSALAAQVTAGAPADVLATADTTTMATVVDAGEAAGEPVVFARNRLQLVVPAGNPGDVTGLADLADDGRTVALCAPEVPCGSAAGRLLGDAGVRARPDTLEQDARAVLSKVRLGEVDAALVYRTDVRAAGDEVEGVDVPGAEAVANDYPVVALAGAPNPAAAAAFVEHVLSPEGRATCVDAGFDSP